MLKKRNNPYKAAVFKKKMAVTETLDLKASLEQVVNRLGEIYTENSKFDVKVEKEAFPKEEAETCIRIYHGASNNHISSEYTEQYLTSEKDTLLTSRLKIRHNIKCYGETIAQFSFGVCNTHICHPLSSAGRRWTVIYGGFDWWDCMLLKTFDNRCLPIKNCSEILKNFEERDSKAKAYLESIGEPTEKKYVPQDGIKYVIPLPVREK